MLIKQKPHLRENEVTDHEQVKGRRRFIQQLGLIMGAAAWAPRVAFPAASCDTDITLNRDQKPNSLEQITSYNNYYEFSTNKEAVRILAQELTIDPWTLRIDGEVEKPLTLGLEDILKMFDVEERIYSLRCVEGWSLVIPWNGFSLCKLLRRVKPTSKAKYVAFSSLTRPSEMIGQRITGSLNWPYQEGLRIDEAMHPLTLIATGLYGETLPKQNGAPLRLVVPWKYGYKSAKAITHIQLTEHQPVSSWCKAAPSEYGFLGNVNPDVAHPRWSQRRENRIGELRKRRTEMFNGYAEQVAGLYSGLDLSKKY